ncbi:MAG: tetratricopeptide repeat protein [Archangium sp.]
MRLVALCCFVGALSTFAAPPKLSTPKELMELMEKSPNHYRIQGIEELELARGKLADEQWKPLNPRVDLPKLIRKGSAVRVTDWPKPSAATAKFMEAAERAYRVKDFAEAEKQYRAAIKATPSYYIAHAYLGDALLFGDKKDVDGALAAYEQAITLNPDDYRLYFFRSTVHRKLGNSIQAVSDLRHALMLKPRNDVLIEMVRNSHGTLGLRAEPEIFVPRAFVRRGDDGVDIYVDGGRVEWLAWANCKAVWLGEPAYRKARGGGARWTSSEDFECLMNLVSMYESQLARKEGTRDDRLDRLVQVADDELLDAMVVYEFASRIDPMVMLKVDASSRERVARYIEKYVLTSVETP